MFKEEDHKRVPKGSPEGGRFTKSSDGAGGVHEETAAESKRLEALGIDKKRARQNIDLSKQEYAILRKEVMRKNSAQKGKIKPINCAFTANYFYVYLTNSDDNFEVLKKLNIEADRQKIDEILSILRR